MDLKSITGFIEKNSSVIYRYYVHPSHLVGDDTQLFDILKFSAAGFALAFGTNALSSRMNIISQSELLTSPKNNDFILTYSFFAAALMISVLFTIIQTAIGKFTSSLKPSEFFKSSLYCFSIGICSHILLIAAFAAYYDASGGNPSVWVAKLVGSLIIVIYVHMIFVNLMSVPDRRATSLAWVGCISIWATFYSWSEYRYTKRLAEFEASGNEQGPVVYDELIPARETAPVPGVHPKHRNRRQK